MEKYAYVITLKSDAEPSNGAGGEYLNTQLPRDDQDRICIPASHLKGLMRENLSTILGGMRDREGNIRHAFRSDADEIVKTLFGTEEEDGDGGKRSLVRITSASAVKDTPSVIAITRTSLEEDGSVKDGSLRTAEALGTGTELEGEITCDFSDETLLKAVRLALISVTAVGGGRTRGAGECRIRIKGHDRETPGQLFREIVKADVVLPERKLEYRPESKLSDESFVKLKITFSADQPVCIPQQPSGKSNVITSGFAIPGSALAGTLLTLMSSADPDVASACYRSPVFRCYPLLPVGDNNGECIYPVYISNSHKISKLPEGEGDEKRHLFGDTMIPDDYLPDEDHWQEKTRRLAMKGTNGVLLVGKDKKVSLLKAGDIPRIITAHGVVNGTERQLDGFASHGSESDGTRTDNLFTQEAVSVSIFEGIVFMPKTAADTLLNRIGKGVPVAFGKSKSTMGGGILTAERCDIVFQQLSNEQFRNRLFIVQTPIIFDGATASTRAVMAKVLKESGWGELEKDSVMTSVIFGWNELGLEKQIRKTHRVGARRMIVPGSVFLLKEPIPDAEFEEKLAAGLGIDRKPGFGAVIPHPMFASRLVEANKVNPPEVFPKAKGGNDHPVYAGYRLDEISKDILSPSQIARILHAAQISSRTAMAYLENQRASRPPQIWDRWADVFRVLFEYLGRNDFDAVAMLKVWHDLRKARKEDRQ